MLSTLAATVTILSDRNATVASVEVWNWEGEPNLIEATGSSKREQGDIYNADIARDLAVGRAFEKLGRKLKSRGKRAVDLATTKRAIPAVQATNPGLDMKRIVSKGSDSHVTSLQHKAS